MRFGTPPNGRTRALLSSLALGMTLAAPATVVTGCVEDVGLVDRTSPYKLDKKMFEGVWMYTITTVDVPYSSAVSFSGETPFGTARKIIFDIQEDHLIAYPVVETVEGSEKEWKSHSIRKYWDPKNRDQFVELYVGPPVARWPIESHFDVNRSYNTFNGAQSNEIVENTSDRPWYERDYIRVSWARQGLQNFLYELQAGNADSYFVGEEKPGNPDEFLTDIEGGYFDYVIRTVAQSAAQNRCSIYDLSPYDCARTEVKVRHSFRRYDPKRDYEPIRYQNEVYQDRFGFFSTDRYAYDYDWGPTYRGKVEWGNRWNLWKNTYDFEKPKDEAGADLTIACFADKDCDREAGQRCQKDTSWFADGYCATPVAKPYSQRGLRPIIYHLSADWHPDYVRAAYATADGWSDVFKDAVAWLLMWEEKGVASPRACDTNADCATADLLVDANLLVNDNGIACHSNADCSELCGADGYCQATRTCNAADPCADGQTCTGGVCQANGQPVVSKIKVTTLRGSTLVLGSNGTKAITHDNFPQRIRTALGAGNAYVRFLNLDTSGSFSLSVNGVSIPGGAYDANRDLDPTDPATTDFMAAVPVGGDLEFTVSASGSAVGTGRSNIVGNAHYLVVWNGTDVIIAGATFNQSQQGVRGINAAFGGPPIDLALEGAKLVSALPYGSVSEYVSTAGTHQRATLTRTGARGDFTCYKDETVGYCAGWSQQLTDADRQRVIQLKSELPEMFVICENRFDEVASQETVSADEFPTTFRDARYSVNQGDKVYNPCGDPQLVPHAAQLKRQGDSRYSFFYWVNEPQRAGPLGYGPSEADPESGQILTATANIYGGSVHTYAQYAQDLIDLVNGDLDPEDVITGKWIRQYLDTRVEPDVGHIEGALEVADREHDHGDATSVDPRDTNLQPELKDPAYDRAAKLGIKAPARWHRESDFPELLAFSRDRESFKTALEASLPKIDPKLYHDRLNKIAGTWIEDLLINDEVKLAAQFVDPEGTMSPTELRSQLSPATWSTKHAISKEKERMTKLGQHDCIMLAEFADDAIYGLALEMKNKAAELESGGMSKEDVRRWVRVEVGSRILQGVLEHEVGHTLGLRHNFSGSTDVFNFFDRYYEVREKEFILCQDDGWCDDINEACAFRACDADGDCPAGTVCASVPNETGVAAFQCAAPSADDASRFARTGQCSAVIEAVPSCTKDSQCGDSASGNVCYQNKCYAPRAQFAPRPFMTDFEKANKRTEFQYTTVMDYGGRVNSDIHSMGKYDYAAIKFGYAQLIDTYSDPSNVLEKIEKYTETFGGSPAQWSFLKDSRNWPTRGTGFYHPFNYLTNYIGVEENLKRTPVPFHVLRYQHDMTSNDVREILDWDLLEVPYAYCSDEYRGNMGCYYFDQGIDMGEMAQGATDQLEEYYIFDAFKRERLTYGSYGNPMGYYARLMDRYYRVLGDVGMYYALYDNFLFRYSWYNEWKKAPLGGRTMEQAAIKAFSTLKDSIASPAPGSYKLDPTTGYYTNISLQGGAAGADFEIPFGVGRFPFTQFGADLGYYYYQHPLWFGSFWEKLGALVTLTDSTAYFVDTYVGEQINIGVGTSLGYNTVFSADLNNFLGGVIAGDLDFYAGRAIQNRYVPPSISGTNVADKPVEPALNNFTMKLYASLYGLAFIPAGFDPQFIDRLAVFLEGEATQYTDGELAQLQEVRFNDPLGGKVYVAYTTNYGDFGEPKLDVSAQLVLKAQDLADDWAAESDPVQKAKLQKQMGDVREVLDVLRQLNHVYGSSTLGL